LAQEASGTWVTSKNIDVLLKYLPVFERADYAFVKVEASRGQPYHVYSQEVVAFLEDFHQEGLQIRFNWPAWDFEVSPEAVATADVETLLKVLTRCVRQDRFCEGALAYCLESGQVVAVLRRLKQIRETLGSDDIIYVYQD